jgi:hypothetical protein
MAIIDLLEIPEQRANRGITFVDRDFGRWAI